MSILNEIQQRTHSGRIYSRALWEAALALKIPRVLYHGTDTPDFDHFKKAHYIYATPNKKAALQHGEHLMRVTMDLKNPLDLRPLGLFREPEEFRAYLEKKGVSVPPKGFGQVGIPYVWEYVADDKKGLLRKAARKAGYDGIILIETISTIGDDEYEAFIAFDSDKVHVVR